jgi:hypothetical protein
VYQYIKYLGLDLVMLLGLYPVAELTRVIIVSGTYYFPEMHGQFAVEIALMWILYLSIIPVFLFINGRGLHIMSDVNKEAPGKRGKRNIAVPLFKNPDDIIRVNYEKNKMIPYPMDGKGIRRTD